MRPLSRFPQAGWNGPRAGTAYGQRAQNPTALPGNSAAHRFKRTGPPDALRGEHKPGGMARFRNQKRRQSGGRYARRWGGERTGRQRLCRICDFLREAWASEDPLELPCSHPQTRTTQG